MTNPSNISLRDIYSQMPASEPLEPWRRVPCYISGVTAVGFSAGSDLLLVLSHDGLGVIDCPTGVVVSRLVNIQDQLEEDYPMNAKGIGPLAGLSIPLAGLWGGGLRTTAPDGWVVHRIAPNWPPECIVLCPPDAPEIDDDPTRSIMLIKDTDPGVRAFGFSDSGHSLVVATTQLFIWHRFAVDRSQA